MILTVTLNAALDITYRVPRLELHGSHRVREVTERPGGEGVNAARVLAALGHGTVVTGFAGGTAGERLRELLAAETSVTDALVATAGATRRTVTVVPECPPDSGAGAGGGTGSATLFGEPGPHIAPGEWERLLDAYRGLLPGADAVALCGSLPPGVPVGAYGTLIRAARAADVPVLLDTGGEPLRRGLAARPDLVKPNAEELAGITGSTEPLHAARLVRRRGARSVVASLGADGLLALTPDGTWCVPPPRRLAGAPAGAGDSVVAALLAGLVEGLAWPERLARAAALAAATVGAAAAGEFDRALYEELLPEVTVNPQTVAA
ncbi:1-phosphofructokinase family hexose kinase [Streptomyces sp. TRM 70361]|uniref:1-phosphofructokinase family hexose kinase n=1 Tax=Streptomyces sp. TRM 70361 TaxID=3116553 RepID=UPI002E7B2036|nr:1-phosphofructokinase family hexose kinase [Streptomyces sp. TRM 70361]MEE1942343.1 1-phosphofructokinase family hexose kinase [Streptomyces sp. TRM 70361]